jgi:hypothetical protein
VLIFDGKEIIEEGMGFGAPVVLYADRAFFSSSAQTSFYQEGEFKVLVKKFIIDTISRKRIKGTLYLNDRIYCCLQKQFHKIYTQKKDLTPILTKFIELLKSFGVNTEFQKTTPRGHISINYYCLPNTIKVEVTISNLTKGYSGIALLNEQGASIFRKYTDSDGLSFVDNQIGAWEQVKAKTASLSKIDGELFFSFNNNAHCQLLRGREKIKRRYSWVGFCYLIGPKISKFHYSIKLGNKS